MNMDVMWIFFRKEISDRVNVSKINVGKSIFKSYLLKLKKESQEICNFKYFTNTNSNFNVGKSILKSYLF